MKIDRCVCHDVPFNILLPIVDKLRQSGITDQHIIFDTLCKQTQCSTDCTLCRPYIRRLIDTGESIFSEIIQDTMNDPG